MLIVTFFSLTVNLNSFSVLLPLVSVAIYFNLYVPALLVLYSPSIVGIISSFELSVTIIFFNKSTLSPIVILISFTPSITGASSSITLIVTYSVIVS